MLIISGRQYTHTKRLYFWIAVAVILLSRSAPLVLLTAAITLGIPQDAPRRSVLRSPPC
jgi:hypothetical protein